MSDTYDASAIVRVPWPQWTSLPDGASQRRWRFELETPIAAELVDGWSPEVFGCRCAAQRGADSASLGVTMTTLLEPLRDDVFFGSAIELFRLVEARFGRLRTIEGLERNHWRPFRGET